MARRRWKGSKSFKRILKGLPDEMREEMAQTLDKGGTELQRLIISRTPRGKTGNLARGVKKRLLRKTLRLRVGLLGTPNGRAKLFYGRILEFGRRSQLVTVTRRLVAGSTLVRGRKVAGKPYVMRVRGFSPRRFVTGNASQVRSVMTRNLKGVWDRAIKRLAGSND